MTFYDIWMKENLHCFVVSADKHLMFFPFSVTQFLTVFYCRTESDQTQRETVINHQVDGFYLTVCLRAFSGSADRWRRDVKSMMSPERGPIWDSLQTGPQVRRQLQHFTAPNLTHLITTAHNNTQYTVLHKGYHGNCTTGCNETVVITRSHGFVWLNRKVESGRRHSRLGR